MVVCLRGGIDRGWSSDGGSTGLSGLTSAHDDSRYAIWAEEVAEMLGRLPERAFSTGLCDDALARASTSLRGRYAALAARQGVEQQPLAASEQLHHARRLVALIAQRCQERSVVCRDFVGIQREGDDEIADTILDIMKRATKEGERNVPRILEVGAGRTRGQQDDNPANYDHFGSPWLSRALGLAFPDALELHVSDLRGPLLSEIECSLFGAKQIHSDVSILAPPQRLLGTFDLVFGRHIEPMLSANPERIATAINPLLSSRGRALLFCDTLLKGGTFVLEVAANQYRFFPWQDTPE